MAKKLVFLNPVSDQVLDSLNKNDLLNVSCEPIISIEKVSFDSQLLDPKVPWVFTSKTAVNAVKQYPFPKTVYCVGKETSKNIPNAKVPKTSTAKELAELIVESKEKHVIFICGDKRRSELPNILISNKIQIQEVVVYKTLNLKKSVNLHDIDGLAFMSPSAVHSLHENGGFNGLPCFAIGATTADALKSLGQKYVISEQSNAKSIVDAAHQYFVK